MLINTMKKKSSSGFSVVELMIGLALGLIVILGLERIFVASFRVNAQTISVTNLNQQLRATMETMSRELRRAGYWADSLQDISNNFQANTFVAVTTRDYASDAIVLPGNAATCITYGYDRNNDGDFAGDASEWRGFRFNSDDGTVELKTEGTVAGTCAAGVSDKWASFIDQDRVVIDALSFTLNEREVAVDVNEDACPGGPPTEFVVFVRDVDISLTAHLASDDSVDRTLRDSVRIRNDRIEAARALPLADCP